ncbi:MAG: polyprenyl synthetase family protein [Kineosporiaceae bacterium]
MSVAQAGSPPGRTAPDPDVRARVGRVLDGVLAEQERRLAEVAAETAPLVECIRGLLAGGKRLRPAFCYWGWRGAGGPDGDAVVAGAAALELFQAAALIHDDLMDDSDTRRGRPAAHREFASLHAGRGWEGDAQRFGTAGAILAGDLCLSWSDELFAGSGLPAAALERGRAVFDLMRTQLMGGQYLDMLEQVRHRSSEPAVAGHPGGAAARARRVIRFKSAKYSVEHPLLLGGTLAGAEPALLRRYSALGLSLGEAFQLRDDLLGVFGDPAATGKPAGDDLREGKRTLLVAYALERATPAQATAVDRLLGDPGLDARGVATLQGILTETGAAERVEALIADDADAARKILAEAGLPGEVHDALDRLVTAATEREA